MRGKSIRTTVSNKAAPCPLDKVNRQFHAGRPNALCVSNFTYVSTWQPPPTVKSAFVEHLTTSPDVVSCTT
jgi:hypothetical protein